MFGFQVILPLIVRLTIGRRNAFVRRSATEALNLQVPWVGTFLLLTYLTVASQSNALAYTNFAIFGVVGLYAIVCGLVGARKAWRGESWRYPVNIRLIPCAGDGA
jgi:uncharacterized Tic20 family protein